MVESFISLVLLKFQNALCFSSRHALIKLRGHHKNSSSSVLVKTEKLQEEMATVVCVIKAQWAHWRNVKTMTLKERGYNDFSCST